MQKSKYMLYTPELTGLEHLNNIIENKTTFTLNNCEFSLFETHKRAEDVKLKFNDLTFTAMLRGKKHMKLEDKTDYFDYFPGETVLVSPGETMVIDFPEADETPSQCISLSFSPDFVENSLNYFNTKLTKIDNDSSWRISSEQFYLFNSLPLASATNNLMRIAMEDNMNKDLMADLALKELLVRLMQTQASKLIENDYKKLKNTSRLAFIIDYIKNNLHQKLSIEHLARLALVSKSNFFKLFKYEIGIAPNEFILMERIKRAKELLKENQSIKEVAFGTGFSDTNHFIKTFKTFEGLTPKNYQRNLFSKYKIVS
jgi:AraC-like DNA-binding protein